MAADLGADLEVVVSGAVDSAVADLEPECPEDLEVGSPVAGSGAGCQAGSGVDSAVEDSEPGCPAVGSGTRAGLVAVGPTQEDAGGGGAAGDGAFLLRLA